MKIKSERDKRTYLIIALCAILVIMGVGYAAFSSLLTINGTASISNSWCVGFDNTKTNAYTPKAGITGGTTPTGSISFSGNTCSSNYQPDASLSATFKQPGDEIEYTLTIKNKSTVPAAIKSILVENNSVTSDTTIPKGNVEFIVHMPESTNLAVEGETTMKVIARFQNTTNVTGPYTGEAQTLNVKINTEQSDGTGGFTPTPATFTGTIYRYSSIKVANHGSSAEDQGITSSIENLVEGTDYVKEATLLNKTFYLKHDVEDNYIIATYACVITDEELCVKADGGFSFNSNENIIKKFQNYYNLSTMSNPASGVSGCYYEASDAYCQNGGGFYVISSDSNGVIRFISSGSGLCSIDGDTSSLCPF